MLLAMSLHRRVSRGQAKSGATSPTMRTNWLLSPASAGVPAKGANEGGFRARARVRLAFAVVRRCLRTVYPPGRARRREPCALGSRSRLDLAGGPRLHSRWLSDARAVSLPLLWAKSRRGQRTRAFEGTIPAARGNEPDKSYCPR